MSSQTFTLEAYQHMREHAGWSYRPSVETAEQGRVRSALERARAEYERLRRVEITFDWQDEPSWEVDTSWMDEDTLEAFQRGDTRLMSCEIWDGPETLASLGGIHMDRDWRSDPYRRVIEAELALEAGICHPLDRRFIS